MAVQPFDGDTFVAFMDISGFKSMMNDGQRGLLALDAFYSAGFTVLQDRHNDGVLVDGFFISDCGVLFVRGEDQPVSTRLQAICRVVQKIHKRTFEKAVQLTTSISWGKFSYQERIEFPGIVKNPIYGNAYVSAFADNNNLPKLYPSDCRIKREGLPPDVDDWCFQKQENIARLMRETPRHFYFEWMKTI